MHIIERKRLQWYGHVKRMQEERLPKLIMEWIPRGEKEKRTSKENVDGRCTSSHDNKTFRSRSVVKQKGMAFGFRKTATPVTRPERLTKRKKDAKYPLFLSDFNQTWTNTTDFLKMLTD